MFVTKELSCCNEGVKFDEVQLLGMNPVLQVKLRAEKESRGFDECRPFRLDSIREDAGSRDGTKGSLFPVHLRCCSWFQAIVFFSSKDIEDGYWRN